MSKRLPIKRIVRLVGTLLAVVVGVGLMIWVTLWLSGGLEEKIPPGQVAINGAGRSDVDLTGRPTDQVHEVHQEYFEESVGTLKAASRSIISAKVLATIDEVLVVAGDRVEAGDDLVRLQATEYETRLNQAKEALSAATATRVEAVSAEKRSQQLLATRAISEQEYERAARNLDVALADERRAQQAVAEAEVLLSYTTITAPTSGRIVDRLAEPGDTARVGEPLLVLYDATSLRLEAPVSERLAVQLKVGQELRVHIDSLDRDVTATVDEIVPQADAPSRSFLVKASLPRSDDLFEGMFGRLRIPAGTRRHLCLATAAVQTIGQLEFVEVVRSDGDTERRFIKTGRVGMPGRIEVLSGLKAGERVVLLRDEPPENGGESATDPRDSAIDLGA